MWRPSLNTNRYDYYLINNLGEMKMRYDKTIRSHLSLALLILVLFSLAGCNASFWKGQAVAADSPQAMQKLTVKQDPGKIVYWVLPGPRRLSQKVFGTPDHPKMLAMDKIQAAEKMVAEHKMPPAVPELLKKLPILVGVPMMARQQDKNGNWVFNKPNMFSDKAMIVSGSFIANYTDVVKKDPPGPPGKTPDKATMEANFTDPAGNKYRVVLDHVVKPPFPGYETQGGVILNGRHHGSTGTGSPLMPEVKTYAAFWGVGDVYINGKLAQPHRVMHMMTTEVVRDKDYKLALDEDLPLSPDQRHIKSQATHTHLVVLPITPVKGKGPTFKPLQTAFKLPNGMFQSFLHIMYEQDEIIQ